MTYLRLIVATGVAVVVLFLVGCDQAVDKPKATPPETQPPEVTPPETPAPEPEPEQPEDPDRPTPTDIDRQIEAAIAALEAAGTLPVLDRSASIAGSDENRDGVRDDVETFIESLPDATAQKRALRRMHRSMVAAMTGREGAARAGASAVACLAMAYGGDAVAKLGDVLKVTVNTLERFRAYMAHDAALSGSSFEYVPCDGDVPDNTVKAATGAASGLLVGYFNGVDNTYEDAMLSMVLMQLFIGNDHDGQLVEYQLFYNDTDGRIEDIVEALIQLSKEKSAYLSFIKGIAFVWEVLFRSNTNWYQHLPDPIRGMAANLNDSIGDDFAEYFDRVSRGIDAATDKHVDRITELLSNYRIVLVAHSQGNLFANSVVSRVGAAAGRCDSIGVVHVAPPSSTLNGPYLLASMDIIRHLSGLIPNLETVADPNDSLGHEFVTTYLEQGRAELSSLIKKQLDEPQSKDAAVLLALRDQLRGTADLNWSENLPLEQWDGVDGLYIDGGCVQFLSLSNRQLTGSIPSTIGDLSNLRWLFLGRNQLTGAIPSTIGNLSNLQNLNAE